MQLFGSHFAPTAPRFSIGGEDRANGVGDVCELARGDLNLDGVVNASDIPFFLNAWGASPGSPADFNDDGVVDGQDFAVLLSNWGTTA